ncbi:unnamed protein product [Cyprideis torosa]|uniref:Uncharacterized protein n=1 Tax=Cyprideis torosa TaxID=163714 RepID=A0A7R8W8J7_9CRUS|nr:unnamed protein product [Cyprideis torosa]CAG0888660.1 unnamed protein product [Cyprideis torosa]
MKKRNFFDSFSDQSKRVISEPVSDTFEVIENSSAADTSLMGGRGDANSSSTAAHADECMEHEGATTPSREEQEDSKLLVSWSYIQGMLMNRGALALDKIHATLLFAFQGTNFELCTLLELKEFLDRKVQQLELEFSGGLYKLP